MKEKVLSFFKSIGGAVKSFVKNEAVGHTSAAARVFEKSLKNDDREQIPFEEISKTRTQPVGIQMQHKDVDIKALRAASQNVASRQNHATLEQSVSKEQAR